MKDTRNPFALWPRAQGLAALAARTDTRDAVNTTAQAATTLVEAMKDTRDIRQRLAYDVTLIPTPFLRLYEQAGQVGRKDLQTRCLDSWDGLLRARAGGVRDLLVSLER
jgi:hypothetical protein